MKGVDTTKPDPSILSVTAGLRSFEATVASSGISPSKFLRLVRKELKANPDPVGALSNFHRFIAAGFTSSLLRDFANNPVYLNAALSLFGHSRYLADILVRNPELFPWLMTGGLAHVATAEGLNREAHQAIEPFERVEKKMDALKRFHRRQILRISARDILEEADLETVTKELSWLADAVVDAVVSVAFQDLDRRLSATIGPTFAVLALGKLGGEELNFSSDIDLMFVYEADGDIDLGGAHIRSYNEYYSRAAESIVRNLTEHTSEGHLYRVDMRLRPDGSSGPLAMARQAYEAYYENRGELWERQMLLKTRVVAGNKETGDKLLKGLRPFIFPSTSLHNPLEEIRSIKTRIESNLGDRPNVKLSKGGIRDIEFVVQAFQLLRSGPDHSIRETNTLRAIEKLRSQALLNDKEALTLVRGYRFLRKVEHRLQLLQGTQTHELPGGAEELRLLGKRMGFKSSAEFRRRLSQVQTQIRKVYDNVFRVSLGKQRSADSSTVLTPGDMVKLLRRYGFANPNGAAALLQKHQAEDVRFRDSDFLRKLFGLLKKKGSPDWGLTNFLVLSSSPSTKRILGQALENEKALDLLVTLCARSSKISSTLSVQPLLFESLFGRAEEFFHPGLDWNFLLPNDRVRFRQFNECKAAIRFLAGDTSIEETTRDLTAIADTVVREIIEGPHDEFSDALREFCIVGLGKYGGQEMMVGSDLDLMILYSQAGGPPEKNNERVVTQFLSKFKTDWGSVYVVDLRLRPEGRNAPLAVEFSYYESYLVGRAEVWEKQALLKARVVYTNKGLEGMFTALRRSVLSNVSGQEHWVEEIRRMREKMELERTKERSRTKDLKLGAGGLVDLEFAIQCLQLKNVANDQSVDAGNSFDAIRQLGTLNLLGKKDVTTIERNYAFLRQLELLIRLNSESIDFVIPADEMVLQALAAGMGITSVGIFLAKVERVQIENHGLLKRVFAMMDK